MQEEYQAENTYTVYSSLYTDFMLMPYDYKNKSLILFVNVKSLPTPTIIPYIFTIDDISKMVLIENKSTNPIAGIYKNMVKIYWLTYYSESLMKQPISRFQGSPFGYYLETLNDSI
jgi:hypothetical protein